MPISLAHRRRRPTGLPAAAANPLRSRLLPRLAGGQPDTRQRRKFLFDPFFSQDGRAPAPDQHPECLQLPPGDEIPIKNSPIKTCQRANGGGAATADLHISWFGNGPVTRNVLLE